MQYGSTPKKQQNLCHAPQSSVAGHSFRSGFVSGSQLDVLQVSEPGRPDNPAPIPHLVSQPIGSPSSQSPNDW